MAVGALGPIQRRVYSIGVAARELGVHPDTLVRAERAGRIAPAEPRADADALERAIVDWLRAIPVEPEWQATYADERTRRKGAATPIKSRVQRRREIEAKIERKRARGRLAL